MENHVCVKGHTLGEGKPLVCVSVMEKDRDGIIKEVRRLTGLGVEMIEWRVDAFADAKSPNAIREVLYELEGLVSDTILVYTFRSKRQGGLVELPKEQIYDIHQVAAETKVADFIDVEYFEGKKPNREIALLQEMGVRVIASHHDFEQTPEKKIMYMVLEQMGESGADIVKLAVMPQRMQDVVKLLDVTNAFHEQYPNQLLITMSMGSMGSISRVAGEYFGSCVTFGAGEQASAPGQLPAEQLKSVLSILNQCITG